MATPKKSAAPAKKAAKKTTAKKAAKKTTAKKAAKKEFSPAANRAQEAAAAARMAASKRPASAAATAAVNTSAGSTGAQVSTDPSVPLGASIRPIEAVPANFAPKAKRTGESGRVTRQERGRTGRRARNRTAIPGQTRPRSRKRALPTPAMGELAERAPEGETQKRQTKRNAAYRVKTGMGVQAGKTATAEAVETRRDKAAAGKVKFKRGRLRGAARKAEAAGNTEQAEKLRGEALTVKAPTRTQRQATEGEVVPAQVAHTPEHHAESVAARWGIPREHLDSFLHSLKNHPDPKMRAAGAMSRPVLLKALYGIKDPSGRRKRGFGQFTVEQGEALDKMLHEAAKDHSRDLHELDIQKAEGRNRGGRARAGHVAVAAQTAAANGAAAQPVGRNGLSAEGEKAISDRLAQVDENVAKLVAKNKRSSKRGKAFTEVKTEE